MKLSNIPIFVIAEDYKLSKIKEWLKKETIYGVDIETTSLSEFEGQIVTIQIATEDRIVVFDMSSLNKQGVKDTLRDFFLDDKVVKVIHNAYFELTWIYYHLGLELKSVYCTMLMAKLVYAGDFRLSASLAGACHTFLNIVLHKDEQTSFKYGDPLTRSQINYAGLDAWIVLPLRKQLNKNICARNLLETALWENLASPSIADIHNNGFYLDSAEWTNIALANEEKMKRLHAEIINDAGIDTLNMNAPAQVKKALAKNGVFVANTGKDTLNELSHPLVQKMVEYKIASKAAQSFGLNVLKFINPLTNRVHANIKSIGSKSGRLSANSPNLMQIPHDKAVRACFKAKEGHKLIIADYSQFELRIVAEASREPLFIDAYRNNIDLHTQTTSLVFKIPFDTVPKEKRDIGKRVNFGTVYGIGAESFSIKFGIDEDEADKILYEFFNIHQVLHTWLKQQTKKVKQLNYTTSASGRLVNLKKAVEKGKTPFNLAKNFSIQGTNADVVKMAAYELKQVLWKYDAKFVNIVHDEIVLEAPNNNAEIVASILKNIMIKCAERYVRIVPVEVDITISDVWEK